MIVERPPFVTLEHGAWAPCATNEIVPVDRTVNGDIITSHQDEEDLWRPRLAPITDDLRGCVAGTVAVVDYDHAATAVFGSTIPTRPNLKGWEVGRKHGVKHNNASVNTRELVCHHPRCRGKPAFRKQWNLERHRHSKHAGEKPYICPFPGCLKGTDKTAFAEPDRLTAHIRRVHRCNQTVKLSCPDSNCLTAPLPLDLLGVHMCKRHYHGSKLPEIFRPAANAASPEYSPCPLWNCSETPPLQELVPHLMRHSKHDLESAEERLRSRNYLLAGGDSCQVRRRKEPAETDETSACSIRRILVRCPMCGYACDNHTAFEDHFDTMHVVRMPQRSHFQAWRQYAGYNPSVKDDVMELKPWMEWFFHPSKGGETLQCPDCVFAIRSREVSMVKHHMDMLADPNEIRPVRRQVLRLYPGFYSHPVWDDMK